MDEFIRRVQQGNYDEFEMELFIMENLLHPAQMMWLDKERLTIADLLNGRFKGEQEPTVQAIFNDWNAKCQCILFKL